MHSALDHACLLDHDLLASEQLTHDVRDSFAVSAFLAGQHPDELKDCRYSNPPGLIQAQGVDYPIRLRALQWIVLEKKAGQNIHVQSGHAASPCGTLSCASLRVAASNSDR